MIIDGGNGEPKFKPPLESVRYYLGRVFGKDKDLEIGFLFESFFCCCNNESSARGAAVARRFTGFFITVFDF